MFEAARKEKTVEYFDRRECGQIARRIRRENKIPLKDLSRVMGVSIAYISMLERGMRPWSKPVRDRFEKAFQAIKDERNFCGV